MTDKRAEVLAWFTEQMRAKLDANQDKGGWSDMSVDLLWELMEEESNHELLPALNSPNTDWTNVIEECADVANFAMMIADTARHELDGW